MSRKGNRCMIVYPELKKIAGHNQAICELIEKLKDKLDCDGLMFECAKLISGCNITNNCLYRGKILLSDHLVDDVYFCKQYRGYCEDDYYGNLWFKTNVAGQFVEIPFNSY